MSEHGRESDDAARPPADSAGGDEQAPRELAVMRASGRLFAVYADEADNVTEGLRPTPLPGAPPAVLGVVCVRGRMRTVLDPLALLGESQMTTTTTTTTPPRFVLSLRGDEQLALAVERVERIVAAPPGALRPHEDEGNAAAPLRGVIHLDDDTPVLLLDPARLFDAAMHGTERRRPRTP